MLERKRRQEVSSRQARSLVDLADTYCLGHLICSCSPDSLFAYYCVEKAKQSMNS
jgi:hypothetical protein